MNNLRLMAFLCFLLVSFLDSEVVKGRALRKHRNIGKKCIGSVYNE